MATSRRRTPPLDVAQLRSRRSLTLHGDVGHGGKVTGSYADGWTNGDLRFFAVAARPISGFGVALLCPDGLPDGTAIEVSANGAVVARAQTPAQRLDIPCDVPLKTGQTVDVRVTCSATVEAGDPFAAGATRRLGAFVEGIVFHSAGESPWTCNVCDTRANDLDAGLDPEGSVCPGCGANMRIRGLVHLVSEILYGSSMPLPKWPKRKKVVGLGVSDWQGLQSRLSQAVSYMNTQFDPRLIQKGTPELDVADPLPSLRDRADFVTCSEVLEHVAPPVDRAFSGLYSLLKSKGQLVMTVPSSFEPTVEHFPELHDWTLLQDENGRYLRNVTANGEEQRFDRLNFHGGGEDVLEMRQFGVDDVLARLHAAGFTGIEIRQERIPQYGIFFKYDWSLPVTARKP